MTIFLAKKSIFITAIDTGVGKTFVASGLASAFYKEGFNIGVMKPIATGCRKVLVDGGMSIGDIVSDDAVNLCDNAGVTDNLDIVNPIRYEQPLAPFVAAKLAGNSINLSDIFFAYKQLLERHEFLIIEGIGGLMVPILEDYYVSDLIKSLEAPVIIVTRPNLGTINHTILTVREAYRGGLDVLGIIINHSAKLTDDPSIQTNGEIIEEFTGVPILGIIPYSSSKEQCEGEFQKICNKIIKMLVRKI